MGTQLTLNSQATHTMTQMAKRTQITREVSSHYICGSLGTDDEPPPEPVAKCGFVQHAAHQNGAARTDCVEGTPSLRLRGIHRTYGCVRGAAAQAARQRQPASDRLRFDARWYAHAAAAATAGGPLAAKQSCHGARTAARMEERGKGLYARCFLHAMSAAHRIHTHF